MRRTFLTAGRFFVFMLGATALAHASAGADESKPAALRVTIDGQPISQEMSEGFDKLRPGDILDVDFALVLGTERELHFTYEGDSRDKLFVVTPNSTKRLVGVRVTAEDQNGTTVVNDPLSGLSEAEMRGLWGIELKHWVPAFAEKLKQIEPTRCCVQLYQEAFIAPDKTLPPLPSTVRILRVEAGFADATIHFESLARLTDLRRFRYSNWGDEPFDCAPLKNARRLEALDLSGSKLKNTATLATLTELQDLDLRFSQSLDDISFVAALKKLELLKIGGTNVADLGPLDGLPRLRHVNADQVPIRKLPRIVPKLEKLELLATTVSTADLAEFQQTNPTCIVDHRLRETLNRATAKAVKVRVRSGGTCHRDEKREKVFFETSQAADVKQLLNGLEFVEDESGFHCMCCGNPSIEFYDEHGVCVTLGFHHGRSLRWTAGWPGDSLLTEKSSVFLIDWLADHGATGPRTEREEAALRKAQERRGKAE